MVTDSIMESIEVAVHGKLLFGYWGWKQGALGKYTIYGTYFLL